MILIHKVLIAAWVFLLPGLIMGETGWMAGTFLHWACALVGVAFAIVALVLAVRDLFGTEED